MLRWICLLLLISFSIALETFQIEEVETDKIVREEEDGWNLVFLQSLWRHGDRNPIYTIPKDPLKDGKKWTKGGGGLGQLTPVGMSQHFRLGAKLRNYYNNFVSKRYISDEIYVRSTDVNRTLISALSNMIGFYHGQGVQGEDYPLIGGQGNNQWPDGFIPIPIHTVPEKWDAVLGVFNCKFEKTVRDKLKSSPEYKKAETDNKALIDQVAGLTGIKDFKLEHFTYVFDTLFIEKTWYKMPDGFTEDIYNKIEVVAGIVDNFYDGIGIKDIDGINFSTEVPRLNGGPLLWEMIDNLKHKQFCLDKTGKRSDEDQKACTYFDTLKYYVFSAHDTTISSLFSTFGFKESNFNNTGLPHYASCVTIELLQSKDKKNYKVKVLYWPELHGPEDVTPSISGCEKECSVDTFVKRSQPYKIEDMEKYCNGGNKVFLQFGLMVVFGTLIFVASFKLL